MLRKLELDSLKADLAAVEAILSARSKEADPIGWIQFGFRKQELEQEIKKIEAQEAKAGVGLFFGGAPVLGSKGILAEFAGKAVKSFQDLISKRFADIERGVLGSRGPIPMRSGAQMMITDVVRGSFGFVLEDAAELSSGDDPLRHVVEEVSRLIWKISTEEDGEEFETVLEALDGRILVTLKEFFQLLDDSGATLRLVEGNKDYCLNREAVSRAKSRTETMQVDEREDVEITGELFMLPSSRKFELNTDVEEYRIIKGSVSAYCLEQIKEQYHSKINKEIVGRTWRTKMKIREVREKNRPPRNTYTLMELVERIDQNEQE